MADWYIPESRSKRKRGVHPAKSFLKYFDMLEERGNSLGLRIPKGDAKWDEHRDLGQEMMENYVDLYGKDERYVVLYPEMPFSVHIFDEEGNYLCTYVGVSDAFVFDLATENYGLFEHKTAAAINTNHLILDEQASTYWGLIPIWLKKQGIIKPGMKMDFMLYNFMRKGRKDKRPFNADGAFLNKDGTVSKSQPPPLFKREIVRRGVHDRQALMDRIRKQVREMNMVRTGELDIYKRPSRDCSSCALKDMCELHEIGADWETYRDLEFAVGEWDPYGQHVWAL